MSKENKEKTILALAKSLQEFLNPIYINFNVDMSLYQPGLEPLSIIGKSETEIVTELKNNLFLILARYSQKKQTFMRDTVCQKFFGLNCESLINLAEKITAILPILHCAKENEAFSKESFVKEIQEYVEENINEICLNMLINYIQEACRLILEFQNFTITTTITEEYTEKIAITSPQTLSQSFRIFYVGDNCCYCTIADALRSNQEKFVP